MKEVVIRTDDIRDYIRLCDALKFSGAVQTGGHAKAEIEAGQVLVNGEICRMRGKKLRKGDTFTYGGTVYLITV